MAGRNVLVGCFLLLALMSNGQVAGGLQAQCFECGRCMAPGGELHQCHCDSNCKFFGDCCFSPPNFCPPSRLKPLQAGVEFECHFVYLNLSVEEIGQTADEGYLMVSSCPDSWPVDDLNNSTIQANCASDDFVLPPVTDTATGIIYKNEFCGACNGVELFRAWESQQVCTDFGYGILLGDTNLTAILLQFPDFFSTYCQTCLFSPPNLPSAPPPRTCAVAVKTCLNKSSLEQKTQQNISESEYLEKVQECEFGPLETVSNGSERFIFRNQACAQCNGAGQTQCLQSFQRRHLPQKCEPTFQDPPSAMRRNVSGDDVAGFPLSVTLANLGAGQVSITTETEQLSVVVECPPGQAPVGLECRATQCPEGYSNTEEGCVRIHVQAVEGMQDTDLNCSLIPIDPQESTDLGNGTVLFNGELIAIVSHDDLGRPLVCTNTSSDSNRAVLDCPKALLPLNDTEFEDRGNGTIFFDGETVEVMFHDSLGRPLVCPDNISLVEVNTTIITLLPGIAELTYVGCSFSILGSAFILTTYTLFSELRTLPTLLLIDDESLPVNTDY